MRLKFKTFTNEILGFEQKIGKAFKGEGLKLYIFACTSIAWKKKQT
jgi:hypothetical protein